jgi:hypothetical protein
MLEERSQSRLFRLLQVAALVSVASATIAQSPRYRISEADIAKKLNVIGISVGASQIHLPLDMSAGVESPQLEIVRAEPTQYNQVRLELRCPTVSECIPFFAAVDVKNAKLVSAEIQPKPSLAIAISHQATAENGVGPTSQMRLRVGSHAVLTIRDGHLNIQLQVLAIDTGVVGQEVRVCTLDRKKIFHATVTGEESVTGVME